MYSWKIKEKDDLVEKIYDGLLQKVFTKYEVNNKYSHYLKFEYKIYERKSLNLCLNIMSLQENLLQMKSLSFNFF